MKIILLSLLMIVFFVGCQEETEVIKPSGKVINIGVIFVIKVTHLHIYHSPYLPGVLLYKYMRICNIFMLTLSH